MTLNEHQLNDIFKILALKRYLHPRLVISVRKKFSGIYVTQKFADMGSVTKNVPFYFMVHLPNTARSIKQ